METFCTSRSLIDNPQFNRQRERAQSGLNAGMLDRPIVPIITALNADPGCFTLQSCWGHFLPDGEDDLHTLKPLAARFSRYDEVEYRIAYIAFCVDTGPRGRKLLKAMEQIPAIEPEYVQFGCAHWFWKQQVNSYVLQVEPERFQDRDSVMLSCPEACFVEEVRDRFFRKLETVLQIV